jgi:Ca2+-binding RTX toxin-like protein
MFQTVSGEAYAPVADFQVSADTLEYQSAAAYAKLGDGGFVAVWADSRFGIGSMRMQRFDLNGGKMGPEIVLPAGSTPQLAPTPTGGFLLTYTVGEAYPTNSEVKARFYDSNLNPTGPEIPVNTTTDMFQENRSVAALADGGFVVTWGQRGDGSFDHVRGQILDLAGNKIGGEIIVTENVPGIKHAMGLTALAGGGFVAAWSGFEVADEFGNLSPGLRAQVFDSAGNKVGAAFSLNTIVPGNQSHSQLAGLPTGGFVAAWSDDGGRQSGGPDNGNHGLWVQLFDSLGQKIGAAVRLGPAGNGPTGFPTIAVTATGFVVIWPRLADVENALTELRAQRFDFAGNKVGEEFAAGGTGVSGHFEATSLVLDSGAILLGWTQRAASGFNYEDVRAQLLFPVIHGTEGGDVFSGTASRDFYLGKGGDDVATGGAGADSLDGGAGDDMLAGGAGADTLDGGDGTDTADFSGEPGPVSVNLHSSLFIFPAGPFATRSLGPGEALDSFGNYESVSGIENLVLTDGDYRVIGSDGANRIEAGAGADEINAMGGDDLLFLGAGDDMASGGDGADEIDGADGSDNLFGDSGSDTLNGGAGEDLLLGGVDGDSLDGGAGDDIMRGEDGDDTLRGGDGSDLLRGGRGVDSFDGGADDDGASTFGDQVSFFEQRATQAVVADLRTGLITNDGFGNVETMVNVESLGGDTAFVDTFYGNDGANALFASKGDNLYGFGGDDRITLSAAAAVVDGGAGDDVLNLQAPGSWFQPDSNGDGLAELAPAMTAGWFVDLGSNLIQDGYGNSGTVQGIESVVGSQFGDDIRGSSGDDVIDGGSGNDFLRLQDGGLDRVFGGEGNDVFLFGGAMTAADWVDGGAGIDQLAIQGNYALTLDGGVTGIESLAILPGNDIRFGDDGTSFYDYDIATVDSNVAAGVQVIVDANRLRLDEDFAFNGSAESDGGFFIWGGGGTDTLTGGSMTDIFYFGENLQFGASDVVNGGAGIDQLGLRGNYTIAFGAGQIVGIESIGLVSAQDTRFGALGSTYNYNLTMNDANLASGVLMTVDGAALRNGETLTFNGSAETNGNFRIFGGQGNDTITTGAGNDIIQGGRGADAMTSGAGADSFRYLTTLDSTAGSIDHILAFENIVDKIDLSRIDANTLVDGNQAFQYAGSSQFFKTGTGGGGAMFAGALRAYESGDIWIVEGDTDGDAVADFVLHVSIIPSPTDILQAFDFIL